MKLPNGAGSVYKLSGKRRNPWVARKTVGYTVVPETLKAYPDYKFIGYYPTKQEALTALFEYIKIRMISMQTILLLKNSTTNGPMFILKTFQIQPCKVISQLINFVMQLKKLR